MMLERSKLSTEDLKHVFDDLRAQYGGDFAATFTALHLQTEERIAELELRLAKLENRKKLLIFW